MLFTVTSYFSDLLSDSKIAANYRWLRFALLLSAIALAALHTWAAITSNSMNEDGINYLDMGDAFMRGDWQTAINPIWSPMYSWILGPVMHFLNPSMRWEFPVAHLVNFIIYLVALTCFGFFWRQVMRYKELNTVREPGERYVALPDWAMLAVGYLLFIFSALQLINIWSVTPDMLMAAFVYLAAGFILRIRLGNDNWRNFLLLGCILGLSYLTKTIMFPLSFVALGIALFSLGNIRRAVPRVLAASIVFFLISGPYIAILSLSKGQLTFGEAGKLTYVRYVNHVPYPHWQGESEKSGSPKHPSRKIFDQPPIYEFGSPVGGTYPISYDPSYWYEGVVPRLDLGQQLTLVLTSALFYFDIFLRQQGALVFAVLILYMLGTRRRSGIAPNLRAWGLSVVALAALGLYALVYVEGRYIGVFIVLLWSDLLSNLSLPESQTPKRLVSSLSAVMAIFMLLNVLFFNLEGLRDLMGWGNPHQPAISQARAPSWPGEVAEELHALGVQPGDKVALIGYGFGAFWARLARVQIVAQMLESQADGFWLADSAHQSRVLHAFASTGARAVVAENVPTYATVTGWHRVGESNYYVYIFDS